MTYASDKHTASLPNHLVEQLFTPVFEMFEYSPHIDLNDLPDIIGSGVYSLFLNTTDTLYADVLSSDYPIYIGKTNRSGGRQGLNTPTKDTSLKTRLLKHRRSLAQVTNLDVDDFRCKFVIFEDTLGLNAAIETSLIHYYKPLWNSYIDGFGINAPGSGRKNQAPSEWDTLHTGRYYAENLTGEPRDSAIIHEKINQYHQKI